MIWPGCAVIDQHRRNAGDGTLRHIACDRCHTIEAPLANAIADAYFLEHRQINDDEVLADIAGRFGFTRDEALAAVHDADELAATEQLARSAAASGISKWPS